MDRWGHQILHHDESHQASATLADNEFKEDMFATLWAA
jgi:hypothetical protein